MSQHYISIKQNDVLVGWDRPLQYFFGTVRKKGEIVFSTLELHEGGVATVAELAQVLSPYIELPEEIKDALREDQAVNRGNLVRHWKLDSESR